MHVSTWMDLQGIMLNGKVSPQGFIYNDKFLEVEDSLSGVGRQDERNNYIL